MGRAQIGETLKRVPTTGGRDGSSTSSAEILYLFNSRPFHFVRATISADRGGACEDPAAPFARPGVYTRASYRGVTRSEGRERANGVGGGIGVGGGSGDDNGAGCEKGDVNGDGVGDGAEAGTETGTGL